MIRRFALILATVALLSLHAAAASAAELVVIVNRANSSDSLSVKQVKAHFLKNPGTWSDGSRVRPVDLATDSHERATFLSNVLDMSPAELERYWISRQYATAEEPPPKAKNDAEMIELIDSLAGGIGFVSKQALDAADATGIKVVLTLRY